MGILDRFRREPAPPTQARGASGRGHHQGFLQLEELNRDLQGRMGLEVFDKMWRTDPEVRRNVGMVTNPGVAATWEVEPYGGDNATPRDIEAEEFARWILFDHMQPNLIGHLAEAIPLVVRSGFAPFEHVWGRAEWKGRDVLVPRRLSPRLPRSIFRWVQNADEELEAIVQLIPTGELGGERTIPRSALTYYRIGAEGDNWEGQSMLRAVYKPWFYKDALERLDMLGHEREAIGYPFVYPPFGTSTDSAQLDELDKDIAAMRAGEDARVIMPGPHAQDVDKGEGGWRVDIEGLGGGEGSRDPQPALQYHKDSIAAAFLAEFMRLGQGQGAVGARATAEEQSNPFEASIEALASVFETEINESLVARAVALNFDDVEGAPKVKMSLADGTSLSELATMAGSLVTAGLLTPDHDLEDYLRQRGDLPPADPEERARRDEEREAGREAMRQATERGEVGPDGKPTVPPRGGPQGKETARSLPKGDDKEGNASKPKERRTEKEKTVERFEDEPATFARQDRPLRTFEEQMDLDRIEAAIDGARERFEQAAGARVRAIAQEVARGGKLKGAEDELAALLEAELSNLYTTGRQTVASELEQQGAQFPAAFAGERGTMTRRARLAARSIIRRIVEAVERLALGGRAGEADLQLAAEREAAGALRAEALVHAAPALNEGRDDEAAAHAAEIAGAQITSILDGNRCKPCADADDDVLRPLDDPVFLANKPPNPKCHGGSRCRCMTFYTLKDEGAQFEFNPNQPRSPGGKGGGRWIDAPGGGTVFKPKVGGRVAFGRARRVVGGKPTRRSKTEPVEQEMTATVRVYDAPSGKAIVQAREGWYIVEAKDLRPAPPREKPAKVAPDGTPDTRLRGGEIADDLGQAPADFSKESKDALKLYTSSTKGHGDAYTTLNRNLRRSKGQASNPTVAALDTAFESAKPLSADAVTYRAVRYAATKTRIAEGETVTDHGFVSTTPARARAEKFGDLGGVYAQPKERNVDLLELTVPAGAKVLDINRIVPARFFGKERELLLSRGTRFRVDSVEPRPGHKGRLVKGTVIV